MSNQSFSPDSTYCITRAKVSAKLKFYIFFCIIFLFSLFPVNADARRKPVIGVVPGCQNADYSIVNRTYTDAILRAGGIPVILPQIEGEAAPVEILGRIDGIMFTGGVDVDPALYGEEVLNESVEIDRRRDSIEMDYAKAALGKRMPILAICRGEQMMNVVLGGSLYQDLPTQKPGEVAHKQKESGSVPTHAIILTDGSAFRMIMGSDTLRVNSFHHQAVKVLSGKVKVTAVSEDGIVEAYESAVKGQWLIAVQFHPEMLVRADDRWLPLFKAFVKASR